VPNDHSEYEQAWNQFRVLQRSFDRSLCFYFFVFVCGIPLMLLADHLYPDSGAARLAFGIVMLVAFVATAMLIRNGWRFGRWRCPRCGNRFGSAYRSLRPWGNKCRHCGFFVFQADD
jgi:hypothetical protein